VTLLANKSEQKEDLSNAKLLADKSEQKENK